MTRDEIIQTANTRYQATINRCAQEIAETERQRVAALQTLPGAGAVLPAHQAAVQQAEADRKRALEAADALVTNANQDGADQRYAATGKAIDDAHTAKTNAQRTRDTKHAKAEQGYNDDLEATNRLASLADRDKARADARTKYDAAIRTADREYAAAVAASDRQYVDDLSAAASKEVDIVQAAMQHASANRSAAQAAYDADICAADDARHDALLKIPGGAGVQEAFDARRGQTERDCEVEKAAILHWMKDELAKLG